MHIFQLHFLLPEELTQQPEAISNPQVQIFLFTGWCIPS